MTKHFVRRLNHLLVQATGLHVDYATIQRKVNYTGDFGLLDADSRRKLIGGDVFYVHEGFFEGKTMLFVDDVRITGAPMNAARSIHFFVSAICSSRFGPDGRQKLLPIAVPETSIPSRNACRFQRAK